MKRFLLSLLVLTTFVVVPFGANLEAQNQAADVVATVTKIQNNAVAIQDALPRVLQQGDDVLLGDVISTGADTRLELELLDGSIFKLGERTHFVVQEFIASQTFNSITAQILEGTFQAISGQIVAANGTMDVLTPNATIGIRGTTVWGGVLDDVYEVALIDGKKVVVTTQAGEVSLTTVGEGTRVTSKNDAPSQPVDWGDEKIARAVATVTFDN